ncbi:hypothetical protein [Paracoccus simplex]|uniref:Flagellar protein FliL n=1 Tax=Paracoccus simplex TaxID=2086346 RepID=A0ABV7S2G0_9RHOB
MKKILILLMPLLSFVGGAIGGDMLHAAKSASGTAATPSDADADAAHAEAEAEAEAEAGAGHGAEGGTEGAGHGAAADGHAASTESEAGQDWFKFPNQFFVPILRNGNPTAIMVLSLTIEMPAAARPEIEAQEHRLRDALLNALMVQANTGGFDGNFTAEPALERLREALLAAARKAAGPSVQRILIEDIGRQEQ